MPSRPRSKVLTLVLAVGLLTLPAAAQDSDDAQKSARELAREARIAEYLKKKEERLAKKEQRRQDDQAAAAARAEQDALQQPAAPTPPPATAVAPPERGRPAKASSRRGRSRRSALPRNLARAQENVRASSLGLDPTVQSYLELVDNQLASPQQLGAFGNFLAQAGMTRDALEYYVVALRIDRRDPVLWINVGTLHRQLGELQQAAGAYAEALRVDNSSATAHYNLGAVLDELGKYEEAINEYKLALQLDPALGDPAVNPQAANNDRLTAVKLMLYREQAGSVGLPLIAVPGGDIDPGEQPESDQR